MRLGNSGTEDNVCWCQTLGLILTFTENISQPATDLGEVLKAARREGAEEVGELTLEVAGTQEMLIGPNKTASRWWMRQREHDEEISWERLEDLRGT